MWQHPNADTSARRGPKRGCPPFDPQWPNLKFARAKFDNELFVCTFIHRPERFPISRMICLDNRAENAMTRRQMKLEPERVMADVCLGVTVAGLYTLVGMGLIIAFM
jgi:hypothetical protein